MVKVRVRRIVVQGVRVLAVPKNAKMNGGQCKVLTEIAKTNARVCVCVDVI